MPQIASDAPAVPDRTRTQSASSADDVELRIEREFATRPERVFAAFTERDMLMRWFGPQGFTCPHCELELKPGGRWRLGMRSPEGQEHWVSGVYLEVVPNRRLAFTWGWEERGVRGAETTVTLDFEPSPAGTRLVLHHRGFASEQARDAHRGGWMGGLAKIEQALADR